MKKRLSKKAIAGIALLGTAALTGSVFAGWLIVDSNANAKKDGNVTVYEVIDKSLTLENVKFAYNGKAQENDDTADLIYGKPASSAETSEASNSRWFDADGDMQEESFPSKLKFDVLGGKNIEGTISVSVTFAVTAKVDVYKTCLTSKYISGYELDEDGKAAIGTPATPVADQNGTRNKYSYTIDLNFGWGEHFGKNPFVLYNEHSANEIMSENVTYYDDAIKSLGALYELNGAKYSIIIDAKVSK